MDPLDNVSLANYLRRPPKQVPEEAAIRCACGRAYYAAHAVVRDLLDAARIPLPRSGEAHGLLVNYLKSSQDADVRAMGNILDQLRASRKSADYHVGRIRVAGMPFNQHRADIAILQAQSVIDGAVAAAAADKRLFIPV